MVSNCPICNKPLKTVKDLKQACANNAFYPFCSKRCKLLDLGAWLDSKYSIPANENISSQESTGQ
ncbi:MAG: DNA gyrase inhibitor YacG [Sedimentisphaerales bacterium]|nr:DNA gyrase inhibitor YacG [Sedimentisphaerales bacterium]